MAGFNPQTIIDQIQKIARHGIIDQRTGAIHGTERIVGYVAKIHDSGELAGTVDVQEYIDYNHQDDINSKVGYHEGVYISAIQNSDCYVMIPKLYSDVVIVRDVATSIEYVAMFSHVDTFKVDAHTNLVIGVSEREEYRPDDENAPDVDELEPTGLSALTTYDKDSVGTVVTDSKKTTRQTMTVDTYELDVNGKSGARFSENEVNISKGNVALKLTDSAVELGSADEPSVLGQQLVSVLSELLSALSALTVPCSSPGSPSGPPVNIDQFTSINGKLNTILSQSVKLKK